MDKETEILSRLAANHLHLAQFEPLRATLLALKACNPDLTLAILQTIVSNAGRFENVLWWRSCPSPSVLAFLSTIELLRFDDPTSPWGFGPETLRLRADFVLLVQVLIDRVTDRLREVGLERIEREKDVELVSEGGELEEKKSGELLEKRDNLVDMHGELGGCVRVLNRLLELGVERLKFDSDASCNRSSDRIEEEEIVCLRRIVLDYADVFDALCCNIEGQLKRSECYGMSLVLAVRREEKADPRDVDGNGREEVACGGSSEEDDSKVFALIRRNVQIAHLDVMKECLKEGDEQGAVDHIRFLHLEYGVEKEDYRAVLQDLLIGVMSKKDGFGDSWHVVRDKLLHIYKEALSSNCEDLVQMIQIMQDDMLLQEIGMHRSLDGDQILAPLERFRIYLVELKSQISLEDKSFPLDMAISSCMRDVYHYARVSGLHVLECLMDAALSAVKREKLQEANDVLSLFPRLRPLVASMGWDLLSGKTTARRKLMQLLWTSNSQALRLEESSLYANQTDEVTFSYFANIAIGICYSVADEGKGLTATYDFGRNLVLNISVIRYAISWISHLLLPASILAKCGLQKHLC